MIGHDGFFHSPNNKGYWTCVWGFTPRHAPTSRVVPLQNKARLSPGRIVLRVTIAVTLFIPHVCQTLYCRLLQGYHGQHQCCTVVTLYDRSCIGTAVKRRNQGTPLAIRPKIIARLVEAEAWGEKYYYQQSSQYLSICNNYTLISICNT